MSSSLWTPTPSPPSKIISTSSRPSLIKVSSNPSMSNNLNFEGINHLNQSTSSNNNSNNVKSNIILERNENGNNNNFKVGGKGRNSSGSSSSIDGNKSNNNNNNQNKIESSNNNSNNNERGRSNSSTRIENEDALEGGGGRKKRLAQQPSTSLNSITSNQLPVRLPRSHSSTHPTPRSRSKPRSSNTLPTLLIPSLPTNNNTIQSSTSIPTPITSTSSSTSSCCPGFIEKPCDPTLTATSTEIAIGESTCDYRRKKADEVLGELIMEDFRNDEIIDYNENSHFSTSSIPYYESSLPLPQSSLPSPHSSPHRNSRNRDRSTSRYRSPSVESTSTIIHKKLSIPNLLDTKLNSSSNGTSRSRTSSTSGRDMSTSPIRIQNKSDTQSNHNTTTTISSSSNNNKNDSEEFDSTLSTISTNEEESSKAIEIAPVEGDLKVQEIVERPPLHSYTSFDTTFDLHPPPSPPPSPPKSELGKAWWRA